MIKLSIERARRLAVASQGIYSLSKTTSRQSRVQRVVKVLERLSYVQIDTICVVQRAHHHVFWSRLPDYQTQDLSDAVAQKKVFEYWSHAAAYLPIRDYRFSLQRKREVAASDRYWLKKDPKQTAYVRDVIRERGPMMARDFKQVRSIKNPGWGDSKPAKQALERLFMEGELMICGRQNFQKVFDLSERVLPSDIDTTEPNDIEFLDYLIFRFLEAHGFGNAHQIAYLRKGMVKPIDSRCKSLLVEGRLVEILVGGSAYYALLNYQDLIEQVMPRSSVKILSPFDNLLIQRKRVAELFSFDYQIECYVPADKRKYGYFVLPILKGNTLFARMDARVNRKTARFEVLNLWFEAKPKLIDRQRLVKAIREFAKFNESKLDEISLDKIKFHLVG